MTGWRIDPDTLTLVGPHPPEHRYTGTELATQEWPPCPVCGEVIELAGVAAHDDGGPTWCLPEQWGCPNGCDPRQA